MISPRGFLCVLVFLAAAGILRGKDAPDRQGQAAEVARIGEQLPSSATLRDLHGTRRPLHSFRGPRALVLAFLSTECPLSNLYLPTLLKLEKQYRAQGAQFLAVYSSNAEDLDQIGGHAVDHDIPFPVLKDCGQELAARAGVTRVPTVLVLDQKFRLCYRGRVDDRYGAGSRRAQATRGDLAEALTEVLAGRKVGVSETDSDGCILEHASPAPGRRKATYCRDVAPILQQRCQGCHREGQSGPFPLTSYEEAVRHARMIQEVTSQRRMPPWHADPRYGHFSNDRRLTQEEVDTLAAWVEGGKQHGEERDLPEARAWLGEWVHGKPDMVFSMPKDFEVPAEGVLDYKSWIIKTNFTEDRWVRVAEGRPGAPSVVHHIVAYILRDKQDQPIGPDGSLAILVGWAPGDLGLVCPPDTALRIPKGARLRLEMHYTPNGKAVKDRSSIGITFASRPPKYELVMNDFSNMGIEMPPNDPHYRAEASFRFPADARILSFTPHMHWRGKNYLYEVIYPDGKRETLLSVPRWDFNWQNVYRFAEPLKVPRGTRLHAVAHWDNSANNLLNPDPTKTVRFGLQTWEEMMVGFVAYVWEHPEEAAKSSSRPPRKADLLFNRLDVNGDDMLSPEEIPSRMRPWLRLAGVKESANITRDELAAVIEKLQKLRGKDPARAPGGKKEPKEDRDRKPAKDNSPAGTTEKH